MKNKKKLFIMDGFTIIFKAFYAFINTPLRTSKGEPTSAIFGFVRMLIKFFKDYNPDYFVIALDSPVATFRHTMYSEYKANRSDPPNDLKIQIPLIIDLIDKFKLFMLQKNGYEADDIIGTICEKYKNQNIDLYIITGDKDILQLVGSNTKVLTTSKGVSELVKYDENKVKEKWGVYPDKIIDLFALMGDSSDNIPGVKGIGPKTALKLINEYDSVDNIYNNIDKVIKKRLKDSLINDKENAFLSKKLVSIDRHVPIDFSLNNFANPSLHSKEGIALLEHYELFTILRDEIFLKHKSYNEINSNVNITNYKKELNEKLYSNINYSPILNLEDFKKLIEEIKNHKLLSIDLETNSEDPMKAKIIGISFSTKPKVAYFMPIMPKSINNNDLFNNDQPFSIWSSQWDNYNLTWDSVYDDLKYICEDDNIKKIGQNIKYDYIVLKRECNINLNGVIFDTMIASYLLNPGRYSHGMDYIAKEFLNYDTVKYSDIVGKNQTLLDITFDKVLNYACEDADITLRLYEKLKSLLDNSMLHSLYYDVELPLIFVLAKMEINGVLIDIKHFRNMSLTIDERLKALENYIHDLVGIKFNINSPKQLSDVLFNKLKLKPGKKTKTGYSTDVSVLESLSDKHEVPYNLLEYRKLNKLKSSYLDSIAKLADKNNRVHTSFNQAITQTGRLSSNNPNLQNIPIKEDIGRNIRKGFIAKNDFIIMSADYSQIELRILAHVSKDPRLIEAYTNDKDIHGQTAKLIFGKSHITNDERRIAKTINFSVIYGIGANALSKNLKVSAKEAKNFIDRYFDEYKGVREYIETQKELAYKSGFVTTLFNRIRYIPELNSNSIPERKFGERLALNTPIQGTSADIIKIAMVRLDKQIREKQLKSFMTIQVHDELVFEVHKSEVNLMKNMIINTMESATNLLIPIKISLAYGENWDEAH